MRLVGTYIETRRYSTDEDVRGSTDYMICPKSDNSISRNDFRLRQDSLTITSSPFVLSFSYDCAA